MFVLNTQKHVLLFFLKAAIECVRGSVNKVGDCMRCRSIVSQKGTNDYHWYCALLLYDPLLKTSNEEDTIQPRQYSIYAQWGSNTMVLIISVISSKDSCERICSFIRPHFGHTNIDEVIRVCVFFCVCSCDV